jgi:hypothetical protein
MTRSPFALARRRAIGALAAMSARLTFGLAALCGLPGLVVGFSLALPATPAAAQTAQSAPDGATPPDLYQEALQSIAEGRKNDASATLSRLIDQEPLHAGAWLELALIQCGLGHADEAERLFSVIEQRFSPPPGIVQLIAQARKEGCNHWEALTQMSLTVARGIDQNVNQGSSSPTYTIGQAGAAIEYPLSADFQPRHDQYSQVSGEYLRDITANGSMLFAQFQARRNDTLSQYNSNSLFVGVETPYRFGRWTARTTGMVGLVTLGGQLYQRQTQVQARIGPPLPLPGATQFSMLASATHIDYTTLNNFNSNTGELRGLLNYRNEHDSIRASMAWLDDRALGQRPGGNRHGVSGNIAWRRALGAQLSGELGYSRQTWTSAVEYSPGIIDQVRHQDTGVLSLNLSYPIGKNQQLQLEARQTRNKENISIFQYNNRQLQLSWQWLGP